MDVPAYPGDGVFTTHWCPEQWSPIHRVRTRSSQHERMMILDANFDEAEEW